MLLKTPVPRPRKLLPVTAIQYRLPLPVREVRVFPHGDSYPICPRCDKSMPREYMRFCDRCGQRLSWFAYEHARVVYAPRSSARRK